MDGYGDTIPDFLLKRSLRNNLRDYSASWLGGGALIPSPLLPTWEQGPQSCEPSLVLGEGLGGGQAESLRQVFLCLGNFQDGL
jgi:hypothetical protein